MKKLTGTILLLLLLFSCSKESSTIADSIKAGRVMDGNTGKPLPNTWVYLLKKEQDASVWGMQTINSHQTNKDGYFNFDYTREDNYTYYLVAESEPLYGRTDYILHNAGDQYPMIKMYGMSWVKFSLQDSNFNNIVKELSIQGDFYPTKVFYQLDKDTNVLVTSGLYKVNVWVHSEYKGSTSDKRFILNTTPLDTITYTIKY